MSNETPKNDPAAPGTAETPHAAAATATDSEAQGNSNPGAPAFDDAGPEPDSATGDPQSGEFQFGESQPGETAEAPASAMEAELAAALRENAEMRDQLLRALADAENARRRAARDKEDTAKFAIAGFARDLLETADNLRRALEAVPAEAKSGDPALATLVEGVEATERQMLTVFAKHGLVKIEPLGEPFDPNYHQAMFEVPGSDYPPGAVAHVMQAGYVLNGRLIRPAMVGVAKGEPPPKVDTVA